MGRLAVIGDLGSVSGFGLVGALVVEADDDLAVRRAWAALPDDVDVVILSPDAAAALAGEALQPGRPLRVVMPT